MLQHTKFIFLLVAAAFLLGGCLSPKTAPVSPVESATPSAPAATPTSMPTEPQPTFTPILTMPTLTPSPVPPTATPKDIIYKTIELLPELPAGVRPSGSLVLGGRDSFILHFEDALRMEPLEKDVGCLSTSPDGQWLTYCDGRRMNIESANHQQQNSIWLEHSLIEFGIYLWVNNQQMVFSSLNEYKNGAHPIVVVDPSTGKHMQSPIDFPGFAGGYCGPSQGVRYQFNIAPLVYDPSLTLIVYPDMGDPSYIVLWDLQAGKALAKIEENICFDNYPLWSPNGQEFVVAVNRSEKKWLEDWVSVSREGQVEWLTNFASHFEDINIEQLDIMLANWSPDNRRVAFWLDSIPDLCSNEQPYQAYLALLDVDTQQVINYCFSGAGDPPVWSLDGRYTAIRKFDDQGVSQVLLVDLEQGWAAPIAGPDVWPVGWLNAP
jgi:hypothetical protein